MSAGGEDPWRAGQLPVLFADGKTMRRRSIVRVVAGAVAVALLLGPASASAQAEDEVEVEGYDTAVLHLSWHLMQHVLDELAYFVLLEQVDDPVPALAQEMPAIRRIGPSANSEYQAGLVNLRAVEAQDLLDQIISEGIAISDSTQRVLLGLGPVPIDPNVHLEAYDDLLWQWWNAGGRDHGLSSSPLGELRTPAWWGDTEWEPVLEPPPPSAVVDPYVEIEMEDPSPPPAAASNESDGVDVVRSAAVDDAGGPATQTDAGAVSAGDTSAAGSGTEPASDRTVLAVLVGGLLLGAAALGWATLRTRRRSSVSAHPEEMLEAGRRFLAVSSLDALGAEIADSALRLSGAAGVTFVSSHGSWSAGREVSLTENLMAQVRATGKTACRDDQAVVAVVSGGQVVGIIGAAGSSVDVAAVEQLAPLAGQGLTNQMDRDATELLAYVDALTGVPNRRRFDRDLSDHSMRAVEGDVPVAVAMIDVDHFKTYNDTNGHQGGDDALRSVASLIAGCLRAEDTVYRYGGEEFAVLLPGADPAAAQGVAERIRRAVEAHHFAGGPTQPGGRVTVSIGLSTSAALDGESMVEAADAALYRAKDQGRNQVVLASESA